MSVESDQDLLRELVEPLLAELAPAEQGELFPLLSDAYFAHPDAWAGKDRGGGPLAFGLPELTVLVTPVLLAAMNEIVKYIVEKAMARGTKASAGAIRRLLGRGRKPEPVEGEALALTPAQWSEIRQLVERVARTGGVPSEQAQLIADAVVGQGRNGGDGS